MSGFLGRQNGPLQAHDDRACDDGKRARIAKAPWTDGLLWSRSAFLGGGGGGGPQASRSWGVDLLENSGSAVAKTTGDAAITLGAMTCSAAGGVFVDTVANLLLRRGVELAYVVVIEGIPVGFCTSPDTTGIATAMGDGRTYQPLLQLPSAITREIDLLGFSTPSVPLTLRLLERGGTLVSMFAFADTSNLEAHITADVGRDDTTFTVDSTSGWPSSGSFHHGHERVTYTGITATTFTGCVRGTFPAAAGKASWSHDAQTLNGIGPRVTSKQTVWKGRAVNVYITAKDPDTAAWVPVAGMVLDYAGFIQGFKPGRDGMWTLNCISVEESLNTKILRDQFEATIEGFVVEAASFSVTEYGFAAGYPNSDAVISIPDGSYTLETLIQEMNDQLAAATASFQLVGHWSIALQALPGYATGAAAAGNAQRASVHVHLDGATVGAFYSFNIAAALNNGLSACTYLFGSELGVGWSVKADAVALDTRGYGSAPPVVSAWRGSGTAIPLGNVIGTFVQQAADDLPSIAPRYSGPGFFLIGDDPEPWLMTYTTSLATLTPIGPYHWDGTLRVDWTGKAASIDTVAPGNTILYGAADARLIPVRQVWMAEGRLSKLLYRLLTSTGTADYNTAGDDAWPSTMGCGIPSTLIDAASFQALDLAAAGTQRLCLSDPTPALDWITSVLGSIGAHITWRNGKLTAITPTHPAGMDAAWTLDETNTGSISRCDADDGTDLIRNEVTILYNRDPATGDYGDKETWHELPSQIEHGAICPVEIKADGIYDMTPHRSGIDAWRKNVAATFCAYFAHGIPRYTRSGGRSLVGLALGDIVSFSAEDAPDFATGAIGVVDVRAWVVGFSYDPAKAEFTWIKLLVPQGRVRPLGPAGMLDYNRGDKGYAGAGPFIHILPHEFSSSTETVDALRFAVGDVIDIIEVDPTTTSAPTTWTRTVIGVTASYLVLHTTLSAPAFSTSKRYYVVPSGYAASQASQRLKAYQGNGTTLLIGATDPLQSWGDCLVPGDALTPDPTGRYRAPADLLAADGAPITAATLRDLAQNILNAAAYVTAQQPITDPFDTERSSGSNRYPTEVLVGGPYKLLVPSGVTRLTMEILASVAGGANGTGLYAGALRVVSSMRKPGGFILANGFTYPMFEANGMASTYTSQTVTPPRTATSPTMFKLDITLTPDAAGECWISVMATANYDNGTYWPISVTGINGYFVGRDVTL